MSVPYAEEALWLKSRLFINLAMDSDGNRTFDEQALWAALSLELLAKAALARVSPLLIATPTEDGGNLLIASGLVEGEAVLHSVAARTIFSRCNKAFRPFSLKEAATIAAGRNEYLHGAAPTITLLPPRVWWPRFWAQAVILLTAQDKEIEDFVGFERAGVVEDHLARNRQNIAERATALIERSKQRLALYRSGGMSARLEAEWAATGSSAGLMHQIEATCPACGATGTLEGETVTSTEVNYEQAGPEDYEMSVTLTIAADYFSCSTCRLILDRYELVDAAGLETEFDKIGDAAEYYEPEYGND